MRAGTSMKAMAGLGFKVQGLRVSVLGFKGKVATLRPPQTPGFIPQASGMMYGHRTEAPGLRV